MWLMNGWTSAYLSLGCTIQVKTGCSKMCSTQSQGIPPKCSAATGIWRKETCNTSSRKLRAPEVIITNKQINKSIVNNNNKKKDSEGNLPDRDTVEGKESPCVLTRNQPGRIHTNLSGRSAYGEGKKNTFIFLLANSDLFKCFTIYILPF